MATFANAFADAAPATATAAAAPAAAASAAASAINPNPRFSGVGTGAPPPWVSHLPDGSEIPYYNPAAATPQGPQGLAPPDGLHESWFSVLHPDNSEVDLRALQEGQMDDLHKSSKHNHILETWAGNQGLFVITTATGDNSASSMEVLHNPAQRATSENKLVWSALVGTGQKAEVATFNVKDMFSRTTKNIPETAEIIIGGDGDFTSLNRKSKVPHKFARSRIATPPVYDIIKGIKDLNPESLFRQVHWAVKRDMMAKFISGGARADGVEPNLLECIHYHRRHDIPIPHENLLRDSFAWRAQQEAATHARSSRKKSSAGFMVSTDETLEEARDLLHRDHIRASPPRKGNPGDKDHSGSSTPAVLPVGTRVAVGVGGDGAGTAYTGEIIGAEPTMDPCVFFYTVKADGEGDIRNVDAADIKALSNTGSKPPPSPANDRPPPPPKTLIAPKRTLPNGSSPAAKRTSFAPGAAQAGGSAWNVNPVRLPAVDTTGFAPPPAGDSPWPPAPAAPPRGGGPLATARPRARAGRRGGGPGNPGPRHWSGGNAGPPARSTTRRPGSPDPSPRDLAGRLPSSSTPNARSGTAGTGTSGGAARGGRRSRSPLARHEHPAGARGGWAGRGSPSRQRPGRGRHRGPRALPRGDCWPRRGSSRRSQQDRGLEGGTEGQPDQTNQQDPLGDVPAVLQRGTRRVHARRDGTD